MLFYQPGHYYSYPHDIFAVWKGEVMALFALLWFRRDGDPADNVGAILDRLRNLSFVAKATERVKPDRI